MFPITLATLLVTLVRIHMPFSIKILIAFLAFVHSTLCITFIHSSIYIFIHLYIHLYIHLFIYIFIYLLYFRCDCLYCFNCALKQEDIGSVPIRSILLLLVFIYISELKVMNVYIYEYIYINIC